MTDDGRPRYLGSAIAVGLLSIKIIAPEQFSFLTMDFAASLLLDGQHGFGKIFSIGSRSKTAAA